jgi:hypothetical protein
MGEGKSHVKTEESPEQIEHEIENIRENITDIASELDRRRHELVDWRLQLKKHGPAIAMVAGGCILLLWATIQARAWQAARRRRPMARAKRYREALSRMVKHPERIARAEPSTGKKVAVAAATSVASTVARGVAERLVGPSRSAG